jgi:hypothetical protein
MSLLDKITRANFIPPIRQPHFKVYDYYYNLVVDKLNTMATSGVTTAISTGAVTVDNYGDGSNFTTVLTLTNYIVGPLAGAGAAKVLVPPSAICTLPAGAHIENYFYINLSLTCAGTAVNADVGLGSVAGDGSAYAVLSSATIGITVEDRLTGQTIPTAATGGTKTAGMGFHTAGVLTGAVANNTAAAGIKDVFLNAAGTWNANNVGNLTATGTVVIKWAKVSF